MAGLASDCDWESCLSAVNLGDRTLFICSETVPGQIGTRLGDEDLRTHFPQGTCFALTAHNPGDQLQSNTKNALANATLENELRADKPSEACVLNSFALVPQPKGARFERGFFLVSPFPQSSAAENVVMAAAKRHGQASYFRYVRRREDDDVIQELVDTAGGRIISSSRIVSVSAPQCPPMFADPSYNSVFHGIKKIAEVLKDLQALRPDEVPPDFWRVVSSILADEGSIPPAKTDHPVVVIEGLDGTGKSTLCENLSKAIPNATLLATPPKPLLQFRAAFDGYPALIRRAYYSLGNYIAAKEILSAAKTGPVIVDRYWHSSAAYAIASEVECGGKDSIPPQGHEVYRWPRDLFKPDLAVLLVVSAEVRMRRMGVRGGVKTKEEEWLDRSQKFQERLLGSYERMEAPSLRRVDANGSKEEVLTAVLKVIQERLSTTVSAPSP